MRKNVSLGLNYNLKLDQGGVKISRGDTAHLQLMKQNNKPKVEIMARVAIIKGRNSHFPFTILYLKSLKKHSLLLKYHTKQIPYAVFIMLTNHRHPSI